MIELCSLLKPENILLGIAASSKKRIMELAAQTLSLLYGLDRKDVFEGLNVRERLGSTYLGHGLAVPHCRMKTLTEPRCLYIRLNGSVDNGPDSEPTEAFFFLIVPEDATEEHLQILAQVADLFSNSQETLKLKAAASSAEFSQLVQQWCTAQQELAKE